jgi:hypothetical protein
MRGHNRVKHQWGKSLKISSRNHWAKTVQIYLQGNLMQNQVDTVVKGMVPEKRNFACVYVQNISQYDSGERCGPWASCSLSAYRY